MAFESQSRKLLNLQKFGIIIGYLSTKMIKTILGIQTALAQTGTTAGNIANDTQNQISDMVASFITKIPLFLTALIIAILSFVVARIVKGAVESRLAAQGFEEEHKGITSLSGRLANIGVLTLGITIALRIAGIDITSIIAAGAFAIGFALKDILMNFIAGAMILVSKHYTIGDVIKINGTLGKIEEIQTRATILKAFDGTKIVVPNSELFKKQVVSYTSNPFRKIEIINGVDYGEDLEKSIDVVLNAIKKTKGVLIEPKPSVVFYEWGDYSINFKVRAWVDAKSAWVKTRSRLIININKALDDAKINIPYPIQTIQLANGEEEQIEGLVRESEEEKTIGKNQDIENKSVAEEAALPSPEKIDAPTWLKKAATDVVKEPVLPENPNEAVPGIEPMGLNPSNNELNVNQAPEAPIPGIDTSPANQNQTTAQPQTTVQQAQQAGPATPPPVTFPNNQ